MAANANDSTPDDLISTRSDGPDSLLHPPQNTPLPNPNPKSPLRIRLLVKPKPQPEPEPEPEPEPIQPKPEPDPLPLPTTQPEVVPDHLRCTRNDGRSWRCKKRAVEGQILCGPHLIKLQSQYQRQKDRKRKKLSVKLPKRTSTSSHSSPPRSVAECNGVTLVGPHAGVVKVEEGSEVLALTVVGPGTRVEENDKVAERKKKNSSSNRRSLDTVPESLRCERTNGGEWRCKRKVKEGESVCEFHLNNKKDKKKKEKKLNETRERDENEDSDGKTKGGGGDGKTEGGGGDEENGTRCKRTDGRGWRCKRSVLDGKTLCEIHFEQGRLRQRKAESLKIKNGCDHGDKVEKKIKKKRALEDLENNSNKGTKRMKAELIRVFLNREIIESSNKSEKPSESNDGGEVTKDLPYGLMAIPPAPTSQCRDNAGSVGIKVDGSRLKQTVNRKFRSKNVEPPPISTLKVVPYVEKNLGKVKSNSRKKCHWCRLGEGRMLTKCKTCKKKFFCSNCIKERSCDDQEVEQKCPVCSGSCNCMSCLRVRSKNVSPKEVVESVRKGSKYELLQYMINYLIPVLEQINQEQSVELETEAKLKGQDLSEVEIGLADVGCSDRCCCNNCKSPILDFHRSCPNCAYNLCLSCSREYSRSGTLQNVGVSNFQLHNRIKASFSLKCCSHSGDLDAANSLPDSAACLLSCPPMELGGCDASLLDLRCIFPLNWTKELEISAKEMVPEHESPQVSDKSVQCVLCHKISVEAGKNKEIQEASRRKESEDNLLYCPSSSDDRDHIFVHFQKHWQKGQPVKVRDVLHSVSNLRWNPIDMFTSYLEKSSSNSENEKDAVVEVVNYSDWYNVEIGTKDSFIGCTGDKYTHIQHKTLKLTAKLSSALSRRLFEDHYREIICSLPLEEYTNPDSGLLNLAGKLPEEFPDYKLGPHVCISCGSKEDISRGELVTRLYCNSYDVVNILVHVGDASCSTEQINKIRKLIKQNNAKGKEGCVENEETRMQSGISVEAGVAAASCNSNVNHNDDKSPVKVQCSDTDSDASMICSGISDSPKKAVDQISHQDLAGSSSLSHNEPCGAQWDVFRRQDIPKLLEYVADHVDELNYCYGPRKVVHPIFDGCFYLDSTHKMRLKEEFDIEPWTFNQYLGDAVFIPAGCAYQIRNIKSSVNIAVGFVSPENASECIKLGDEIRVLPVNHKAKQDKLEVEKMAICSLDEAIKEMYRLKSAQRSQLDMREV